MLWLHETEHRPYPPPQSPWVAHLFMEDVLFAHWSVPRESLALLVPDPLVLDVFDGDAWITVATLRLRGLRPRGGIAVPFLSRFPDVNLRTYVSLDGKPGLFFLRLDVSRSLAATGARMLGLPCRRRSVELVRRDGWFEIEDGTELTARYRPTGEPAPPAKGSLEEWLVERYGAYWIGPGGAILCGEIHHRPWPLQRVELAIDRVGLGVDLGIDLVPPPDAAQFSSGVEAIGWLPSRARVP